MRVTLDSNILVYSADHQAGERQLAAIELLQRVSKSDCVLTLQSLAEFFNVTARKLKLPLDRVEVHISDWRSVYPIFSANESCFENAIDIVRRHRLALWDAMLWATAREAGCKFLLSEDLHDGQTIGGVRIVNPFARKNAVLMDAILPPA